ncbi:MAG: hypothetical protein CMO01_01150 [Thalassobius sp.]|nr:hypothetical protein [Thalassovita sp.]
MHKQKYTLILFSLITYLMSSCSPSNEDIINTAREKMQAGKFSEAVSVISELVEKGVEDPSLYNMRGVAYFNLKENSKALTDFDKAISMKADDYRFYYNRGNVKRTLNRPESAVEDYTKAIEFEQGEYEIYLNRALSLMAAHNLSESVEDFNIANQLSNGKDANVHFYRGKAYMVTEDFEKALSDFNDCIAITPENAEAYYGKALAKINLASGEADEETCGVIAKSIELGYQPAAQLQESYCNEK